MTAGKRKTRIAFVGWGAINSRVGALLVQRSADVEIVGVATIDTAEARAAIPEGVRFLADPAELKELHPDLVVEAAGRSAIDRWAPAALANASALIIASTSAFTDDALLPQLKQIADANGSRVIIASGAIGGLDALVGAAVLGLHRVVHQIVKPPKAWKSTPAEQLVDLDRLNEKKTIFSGTAREAASLYPQNANATVVTSLAGIGLDKTTVEMIADPQATKNRHRIAAEGAFGKMEIVLENNPLATNPKSSELTALSLVRLIEQHKSSVVV
jgi:aspartate dehydrogenase